MVDFTFFQKTLSKIQVQVRTDKLLTYASKTAAIINKTLI